MIQKPFDAITKSDIDALIADGVGESKTLEYKQVLPGGSDGDKKEFLADISSFGNASGGDVIYGLKAALDANGKKTGAPESVQPITGVSADDAKLRLEETIRNGIDPRLPVQIKEISGWGANGAGFVIVVRVPKSFASPHMVTFKGASRFFSRNSAGKYLLDVSEVRAAFLATDSQATRIKRFLEDRLGKVVADEIPVPLMSPHRLVLHLVPVGSFLNNLRLDFADYYRIVQLFPPIGSGGDHRYNLDGFVTIGSEYQKGDGHTAYSQVFFNGAVEAVYADILQPAREWGGQADRLFIASVHYEKVVIQAIRSYLDAYRNLGIAPPIVISLALLGCRGAFMYADERLMQRLSRRSHYHVIDRDPALIPEIVVESLDADTPQIMKPIFDAIWNACGFPHSLNYDEHGKWNPR